MSAITQSQAGIVRATALDGALRPRIVGRAERLAGPSWIAILLEEGAGAPRDADAIRSPVFAWMPWGPEARIEFAPGSVGAYVLIGPTALANAAGVGPESRDLLDLAEQAVSMDLDPGDETMTTLKTCFGGVHREARAGEGSSHSLIETYLRIILLTLLRSRSAATPGVQASSPSQRIFNRFSALVEQRFRERWTVEDYAAALGLSRDRLGDVCRRSRGFGPKALIDRRVVLEARGYLENSSNSVEQIAALLGFPSPDQFNRFFHRTAGAPPGRYRREHKSRSDAMREASRSGLHEWP